MDTAVVVAAVRTMRETLQVPHQPRQLMAEQTPLYQVLMLMEQHQATQLLIEAAVALV
jgi:hypothetical protein